MINTVLFIMLSIVIVFMSIISYIAYLPLKLRLKKTGKLTNKISKIINWMFVVIPAIIVVILFSYKDYRTPSNARIERIADIQLPKGYTVLKDEYQDMLQHYVIYYDIKFDNNSIENLIENIKKSKFYVTDIDTTDFEENKLPIWKQVENGYHFYTEEIKTIYIIELDTINCVLKYIESAD